MSFVKTPPVSSSVSKWRRNTWKIRASSLNTKSKRAYVNEDEILSSFLARQHSALNSCAVRNSLVRVDALRRLLTTEELLEELLDLWNTRRTSDKNDLRWWSTAECNKNKCYK